MSSCEGLDRPLESAQYLDGHGEQQGPRGAAESCLMCRGLN